ncbi:ABC transporter ATP-binding protein [Desertivirga xinjiangensis]|uniref:ABC transporter ATP-binding protein n=1 Tax=Desertivirga xinjiangensis TaxID=539206 RepID=UPI00210C2923|nr:ATP-binding cassette domain-containing protein [Pedobacter xinjiangensis]
MEFVLEARGLCKSYLENRALKPLNLSLQQGEIFSLLGPNGAGKSTTINLFLGFIKPSSGAAYINGIEVARNPVEIKRYLAYIPEQVVLYPNLTGLENLSLLSCLAGYRYNKQELRGLLMKAGLQSEAIDRYTGGYSKGMRQKVGIAGALAKKAKVLLLDEPTSGLDPKASNEFSVLLQQLSEEGTAVFMATHDIFRAREVSTRIGIMKAGELVHELRSGDMDANELEKLYLNYMHD